MVKKIKRDKAIFKILAIFSVSALLLSACSSKADETAAGGDAGGTAASKVYTPLAKAPCDLSGKSITFLSVLKGHPTLRLWQQGFLDQANALGFKSATIVSPDEPYWTKAVTLG